MLIFEIDPPLVQRGDYTSILLLLLPMTIIEITLFTSSTHHHDVDVPKNDNRKRIIIGREGYDAYNLSYLNC